MTRSHGKDGGGKGSTIGSKDAEGKERKESGFAGVGGGTSGGGRTADGSRRVGVDTVANGSREERRLWRAPSGRRREEGINAGTRAGTDGRNE